jgi:hypothetical protein
VNPRAKGLRSAMRRLSTSSAREAENHSRAPSPGWHAHFEVPFAHDRAVSGFSGLNRPAPCLEPRHRFRRAFRTPLDLPVSSEYTAPTTLSVPRCTRRPGPASGPDDQRRSVKVGGRIFDAGELRLAGGGLRALAAPSRRSVARPCAIPNRSGHDRPGAAARFTQEGASAHRQATVLDDAPPLRPKLSST